MKKITILFLALLLLAGTATMAQVAINADDSQPDASAILDLKSTNKGFLPPRMTEAQRDAIVDPAQGLIIFNTTTGCLNYYVTPNWFESCGSTVGSISSLDCANANNTGTLVSGELASGISSSVPYTGGNGGAHHGQIVTSMGVTGLTATLAAGSFNTGAGSVLYNITGTPESGGIASFALNIGGQACTLDMNVNCGTVTFTYNGIEVTYGTVGSAGNRCWLDRNLGASRVATSSTDSHAYGDLYQWGRAADGHESRTSGNTPTLATSDTPGHGDFITTSSSPYDWRSPQNDNLWQGVSGTNNPCPSGYRLPTEAEWEAERLSWSSNNSAGAFASPLKLPVAGGRASYDGSLRDVGSDGFYWSSTVNGYRSRYLLFDSSNASMNSYYGRALGFSVRCLKD